ncbi:hypothetical protein SALBM311S_07267 [Streptomyces alboniger]
MFDRARCRARLADVSDLPRHARLAPGRQRDRRPVRDQDRSRAELRDRRVVPFRPEELLLSGHAEELPDLPVRRADRLQRLPRRPAGGRGDLPGGDRARPHGGGHRQVHARRWRDGPYPRRLALAPRLQPRRHPPHRDRHQADRGRGRACSRGGEGVRPGAARGHQGARRVRGPDGDGRYAVRREPVAAPARPREVRHPVRDEERELAAVRGACGPLRDSAARGRTERRRHDDPGDPALPRGHGVHDLGPREGGGRGLSVLPGAGPGTGGPLARVGRGDPLGSARAAAGPPQPAA